MFEKSLAITAVLLTYCLIVAGGLVHATGSGLACPDWPLCNGQFFPQMVGGVEFEHSHRLLALAVTVSTASLAGLLWFRGHVSKTLRNLAVFAVLLVIFQALLGALTVIYQLPMMVKTAHLATSMLFFSTLIALAFQLFRSPAGETADLRRLLPPLWTALVIVYLQIVLGAFVRHTGAGGVCPTLPLCEDSLWPANAHPAIRLHMLHRWGAVAVTAAVFWLAASGLKMVSRPWIRHLLIAAPLLVILQFGLGVWSVISLLALPAVTLHLAIGALLLGLLVVLAAALHALVPALLYPSIMSDILSLSKARLSTFVMLVMTTAFVLADHPPNFGARLLAALIGMAFLTSGASFLNAYFERSSDRLMDRTRNRPLPAGRLSPKKVLIAGVVLGLLGVPILTIWVNPLTGFFGALAYVFYALIYTPLKKRTSVSAIIGAIPGSLPPLIGWTAATGKLDFIGVTLFFILYFWQLPHFFAIAIYRKDEFGRAGIQVMPIEEGEPATRKLMLRHALMLIPVSLFLVPLGLAGRLYFFVALGLGLTYFLFAAYGLNPLRGRTWARRLFVYSLIYLPLLFLTLLIDSKF